PLGTLLQQSPGGVIDAATHHTSLPVLIARVEDGAFRTVKSLPAVAGDPYLTRSRPADGALGLRVVS
ncbi:MAG: N-acetylmuramoyl-L-alanine amidase, partial [Rhodobacteraceae bacterium]|nr:N-acetylmuramoyl-L-alanine amidase [Paracoccaceae bacterium]